MSPEIPERLQAACSDALDWVDAGMRLRSLAADDEPTMLALLLGLDYVLITDKTSERRAKWGPFGPMHEAAGLAAYPGALAETPNATIMEWEAVAQVADPVARSRFSDLLWEVKSGDAYQHCLNAIDAYQELANGRWRSAFSGLEALMRALELSRQLNNTERIASTVEALAQYAADASKEQPPGRGIAGLEVLASLPPELRPASMLDEIRALVRRDDLNPDLADACVALLVGLTSGDEQAEWQRTQVQLWVRHADAIGSPLVATVHLQRALATARVYGLREEMESVRQALQTLSEQELELNTVSSRVSVPTDKVEELIAHFVGADGWREALTRFGYRPAPSGEVGRNEEAVREQMRTYPMQYLMSKMIYGDAGYPIAVIAGDDAHFQAALREREVLGIAVWATFASPILDRIVGLYGRPEPGELAEFFTTALIPSAVAARIARALNLWWDGYPDEAAHLLLPKIETTIRELARQLGLVIFREPIPPELGGVRPLGMLLADLEGLFVDESWRRHLSTLLTNQLGYNLRNRILHGLINQVGRDEAALLINAICFLRLLGVGTQEGGVTDD